MRIPHFYWDKGVPWWIIRFRFHGPIPHIWIGPLAIEWGF